MTDAVFRPRARLLSILGDQLIRDEVVAITELVKNCYDADSKVALVRLKDVTRVAGGIIEVRDDGLGMTPETVSGKWLELATASKTPEETLDSASGRLTATPRISPSGRIQLGEKGVGRLAAFKLGERVTLVTRAKDTTKETEVVCDISGLDSIGYLDEFKVQVNVREPTEFADDKHGTLIRVEKIRRPWSEQLVRKLEIALRRIASVERETFRIRFVCPDVALEEDLEPFLVFRAPYEIEGTIDANGWFTGLMKTVNFLGARPLELPRDLHVDLVALLLDAKPRRRGPQPSISRPTHVGPFTVKVQAFDLDPAGLRMAGLTVTDREMLKELGGISISRDRFRVFPYGEKGDDWLELNQRRVNNPTLRFSNNQLLGNVQITRAANPELRDKTNREGLIENAAYEELRQFVLAILSMLEEARFKVRPRRRAPAREDKVIAAIEKAKAAAAGEARALAAIEEILGQYSTWSQTVEDRNVILLQVAGIGMAAEAVTHDIDRDIRLIDGNVKSLIAELKVGARPELVLVTLDALASHIADLREVVTLLQPLQAARKPRDQEQSIESIAKSALRLFSLEIENAEIHASVEVEADIHVHCSRAELLQVFMNLIDNAVHWLGTVEDRRLEIHIRGKDHEALVRDSGPGIRPDIADMIFEPFFTTKDQGRGLGLYIVNDIMSRRGWSVNLMPPNPEFPGASFLLKFAPNEGKETEKDV